MTGEGSAPARSSMACFHLLPTEVMNIIAEHMETPSKVAALRLVCKTVRDKIEYEFYKVILANRTIYPTHGSFRDFFTILDAKPSHAHYVRKVTLVCEWLKEHEYGYEWAWEDLQNENDFHYTSHDVDIINNVNRLHSNDIGLHGPFIHGGTYRTMLGLLLGRLPSLRVIQVRKLRDGEHVPGWAGPELLKDLSFYEDDLKTNGILYGGWKYDETHLRVTCSVDEFGDECQEDGAGPQASFSEDLAAAVASSGSQAEIEMMG